MENLGTRFTGYLDRLNDFMNSDDLDCIEGGVTISIPRYGDATDAGIIGLTPAHEDADPSIVWGEIMVAMIWYLMDHGATEKDVRDIVTRAAQFFDQVGMMNDDDEEVHN